MDEFKPEDELKPDPSDRRSDRSRQSPERDNDPRINFDDVDVDSDDRRPVHTRKTRDEYVEEEYYDEDDEGEMEPPVERRPRKRAPASNPASRQYIMMGLGILVLLLLIIGIGSALKAPSTTSSSETSASSGKDIDLSGNNDSATVDQANGAQPAPGSTPAGQHNPSDDNQQQDISLPPISSTPTEGQNSATPEGQQRVEVQGNLNSALTQQQGQIDNATSDTSTTLPTEPATVAPVRGGNAQPQTANGHGTGATRPERQQTTIEPKKPAKSTTVKAESKPAAQTKHPEKTAAASAAVAKKAESAAKPTTNRVTGSTATASVAASGGKQTGDVNALKSASSGHYTLQLSSSSNYDNLNSWAKKENIKNYVVYQTTRNGQPWYVLVNGIYATKEEAKRAVSSLPADVQAKNPWTKPISQVQSDLK